MLQRITAVFSTWLHLGKECKLLGRIAHAVLELCPKPIIVADRRKATAARLVAEMWREERGRHKQLGRAEYKDDLT